MQKTFFIAEIGVNHEGSEDKAIEMVETAALNGADAVKFQVYDVNSLASKDSPAYWDIKEEPTTSQFELFKRHGKHDLGFYKRIIKCCEDKNVEFMITPFSEKIAREFDPFVRRHKISSSDITNKRLIECISRMGKQVILSTGAANDDEIRSSEELIYSNRVPRLSLLHCVLKYPCPGAMANISRISHIRSMCDPRTDVGYSCHVAGQEGVEACIIAVALGASIIEKHFTFDKTLKGNDHYHAFDGDDLAIFRKREIQIRRLLGCGIMTGGQEEAIRNARRGLYAKRDIKKGEVIKDEDIIALRPTGSISAWDIDLIIGKVARSGFVAGESLMHEELE